MTGPSSTTEAPVTADNRRKESRLNNQQTEIYLINCIWSYMNCSSDPQRGQSECRQTFSQCADQITEEDQWKGLPSVPGLDLQSLPQSESGFISCILVLYNCSVSQTECKAEFSKCAAAVPLRETNTQTQTSQGNSLQTLTKTQRRNEGLDMSVAKPSEEKSSGDVYTPRLADGSGKIPEIQCTWSFFMCKKSADACKREHSDCLNGDVFDNKICAEVSRDPQRYLVPHPTDCTKFYSCQRNGWGGWIANLMDCPTTTGFDSNLMICNYISALPRCQQEESFTALRARSQQTQPGLVARQTQQKLELEVGELGYLASQYPSEATTLTFNRMMVALLTFTVSTTTITIYL